MVLAIHSRLLANVVARDDEWVANKPVIEINELPGAKIVLCNPFSQTFAARPLLEMLWRLHETLENADVLPSVIVIVLKLLLAVFVLQMQLIASLKRYVGAVNNSMAFFVDLFIPYWVRKVSWFRQVLGNIGNKAEVLDVIVNVVVFIDSVFLADR